MDFNNKTYSYPYQWLIIFLIFFNINSYASTPKPIAEYPKTPLEVAVTNNDMAKITELLAQGANIEGGRNDGYPLKIAILNGQYAIVKLLIEQGAKVNGPPNSFSPLHMAAKFGNNKDAIKIVKLLLAKGADVNHVFNDNYPTSQSNNTTPIYWAMDNVEIVKLLIKAGASLDIHSNVGNSLLYVAVEANNVAAVKLLLSYKLPVNPSEYLIHQDVLYNYAVDFPHLNPNDQQQMIQLLVTAGYDINAKDKKGFTPLYLAAIKLSINSNLQVVRILLAEGADPNILVHHNNAAHLFAANLYAPYPDDKQAFEIEFFKLLLAHKLAINATTSTQQTVLDILFERFAKDKTSFEQMPLVNYLRTQGAKFSSELTK